MDSNPLEVVLGYVREGIPVHPIHNILTDGTGRCSCVRGRGGHSGKCSQGTPGKHPRTEHGFKDATIDETLVRRWARMWPGTNWAITLGLKSGLCAVDVDSRRGGMESLKELYGPDLERQPKTRINKTGGFGLHEFHLYDPAFNRKVKDFLPGLEFLTDGQYVLIPPSNHVSGNSYSLLADDPICEMPEILKEAIRKGQGRSQEGDTEKPEAANLYMLEGNRDLTLTVFVGKMVRMGFPYQVVLTHAQGHNKMYADPPLPTEQVRRIVRSIVKREEEKQQKAKGQQERRTNPAYREDDKPKVFNTLSFRAMMDKYAGRQLEWLIDDWFPYRTTGFIHSKPQCFKSYIATYLAYSLASGEPFLGRHKVNRTGPVWLIEQEDDHAMLATRLLECMNLPDYIEHEDGTLEFAVIPDLPISFHDEHSFKLTDREVLASMEEKIKAERPIAIIAGPFYSIIPNDDNFAKAAFYMEIFKRWRDEYGVSVFLIHHSGKGTGYERMRENLLGSQLLNAWCETVWAIAPTEKSNVVVIERHTKNAPDFDKLTLTMHIETGTSFTIDEEVFDAEEEDAKPEKIEITIERMEAVKRTITAKRYGSKQELARDAEMTITVLERYLKELGAKSIGGYYRLPKESIA